MIIILFWRHFLLTNVPVNTTSDIPLSYCFSEDLETLLLGGGTCIRTYACTHLKYHKIALDFLYLNYTNN